MGRLGYRCYAKVNLTLEIVGRRPDGYHVASVVHTISLADELHLASAPAEVLDSAVIGLDLKPRDNLVTRAAELLRSRVRLTDGVRLLLRKRVPAAAGLGGGSTDAAATLAGLHRLWRPATSGVSSGALATLAADLGSDVPFFLRGGAALMGGRGERLTRLPAIADQWLVLLVPSHSLVDKTRRLYGALETADFSTGGLSARTSARVWRGEPLRDADLGNAFARPARGAFPTLASQWARAEARTGRRFHLSGAGPTLFALAPDRAAARATAAVLARDGDVTFAVHTVAHGRVAVRPAIGYP